MLEELYLQATNYLPSLDDSSQLKEQLEELIKEKKKELKLYEEELKAIKEREVLQLEGLKNEMECKGLKSFDLGDYKISLVDARMSVTVEDAAKCDRRFIRVKEEPDKRGVMNHYKETGVLPEGFSLVKGKKTLRITKREQDDDA